MNYKKPAFWIVVMSVIACAFVAVGFLTNPSEEKFQNPEPLSHSYKGEEIVYDEVKNNITFEAEILEIHDSYFLVEPVEGSLERSSADQIRVSMTSIDSALEPQVGDIIEISYSGAILESYPAQLSDVYNIRVLQ